MAKWPDLWIWSTDCNFYNFPYKEFISGRATHEFWVSSKNEVAVLSRQQQPNDYFYRSELSFPGQKSNVCWPFYQGRPASMGVLSAMAALSRARAKPVAAMAVLSARSGQMARSLDLGCGLPILYCPVQAVYQRPSRAIFRNSWQSKRFSSFLQNFFSRSLDKVHKEDAAP